MLKLALPCTLLAVILCDDGPPIAKIRNGSLRGKLLESRNGRKIYSFTGIPYAKPPLGELRFEVRSSATAKIEPYLVKVAIVEAALNASNLVFCNRTPK